MASAGEKKARYRSVIEMPTEPAALSMMPTAVTETAAATPEPAFPVAPAMADELATLSADANPAVFDAAEPTPSPAADQAPALREKETDMPETYTTAADALKNGAEQMQSTIHNTTENAFAGGKATFDQVASKSREAIEHGMKNVDEFAGLARGNVEAMLASSRAAASGIEAIAREVADFSRKTFDETTAAARAMATVKTPNELMQLQNDFAKTQFDAAVAEMSKLSETMVKLMGEVFEPMQARAAVATDTLKAMVTPK